jgi:hypothetical protein
VRGWYAAMSVVVFLFVVWLVGVLGLVPVPPNVLTALLVLWIVGAVVGFMSYGQWWR